MTREEAIEIFEQKGWWIAQKETFTSKQAEEIIKLNDAANFALSALRPVSREQVERMRGQWQWYKPCRESPEKWWGICSTCGHKQLLGEGEVNFCPSCGAPMTDEAVDIRLKELEALKDGVD